jgi:DNA-binding transcriptional LysR family regulator
MELDLNLVASFLALVEEQHYGHAAQRLHLTPSALSRQIQRLERQLEVVLVDRGPAGVLELTPAGRTLATDGAGLLALAQTACRRARTTEPALTMRIGFPSADRECLEQLGFPGVTRGLVRRFPELHLVGLGVPVADLGRCLAQRRVDVAVTRSPTVDPAVDSIPGGARGWYVQCRHTDRRAAVRAVVRQLAR